MGRIGIGYKQIIFTILVILLLIGLLTGDIVTGNSVNKQEPLILTSENLAVYLESSEIVRGLPKRAMIELHIGEEIYSIKDGKVEKEALPDAEIKLFIPSDYLGKEWTSVCYLVKSANRNNDVRFETTLSKTELIWKYNELLRYRSCLN